jgi:hypothetical protein
MTTLVPAAMISAPLSGIERIPTMAITMGTTAFTLLDLDPFVEIWLSGELVPTNDSPNCWLQTSTDNGVNWDSSAGDYHYEYLRAYTEFFGDPVENTIEALGERDATRFSLSSMSIGFGDGGVEEGFAFDINLKSFNKDRNGWIKASSQHDRVNNFVALADTRGHRREQVARNAIKIFFEHNSEGLSTIKSGYVNAWALRG